METHFAPSNVSISHFAPILSNLENFEFFDIFEKMSFFGKCGKNAIGLESAQNELWRRSRVQNGSPWAKESTIIIFRAIPVEFRQEFIYFSKNWIFDQKSKILAPFFCGDPSNCSISAANAFFDLIFFSSESWEFGESKNKNFMIPGHFPATKISYI